MRNCPALVLVHLDVNLEPMSNEQLAKLREDPHCGDKIILHFSFNGKEMACYEVNIMSLLFYHISLFLPHLLMNQVLFHQLPATCLLKNS